MPRPRVVETARVSGLRVFLTGATGGLGRAVAAALVAEGHAVVVTDLDREKVEAVAAELGPRAWSLPLDVRQAMAWERAAGEAWDRHGGIDVLVNAAGLARSGPAHRIPALDHARMLDVNVMGVIHGVQAFLPRFLGCGAGHIVNVTGFAALAPLPGLATYAASKHAARAYSRALAMELAETPVTVSLVSPGAIETPMLARFAASEEAGLAFAGKAIPAGRAAAAVVRAVVDREPELMVPRFQGRALALVGAFPGLFSRLMPRLHRRGDARRRARR